MHHSPCPFPRQVAFLNSGPFPPPELPGFLGTTSLSATPAARPVPRGVRWDLASHRWASLLQQFPVPYMPSPDPGGIADQIVQHEGSNPSILRSDGGLPRSQAGRLSLNLSRPARCSLALWPANSPHRRTVRVSRRLRRLRCLHRRSDSFGWSDQTWPGGICTTGNLCLIRRIINHQS